MRQVLDTIVKNVPPPRGGCAGSPSRRSSLIPITIIIRAHSALCALKTVRSRPGTRIRMMSTKAEFDVTETGVFAPHYTPSRDAERGGRRLYCRQLSKTCRETQRGRYHYRRGQAGRRARCPAIKQVQPMVFCGIYPADGAEYDGFKGSS